MLRLVRLILEGIGLLTLAGTLVGVFVFFNLADLLQREDKPEKADFIFPLAGSFDRLEKAAQLYKQGFAPKIFMSDGYGRNKLIAARVPMDAIVFPGGTTRSTAEEVEVLRSFIGDRPASILVVASPFEALRARFIFKRTLPRANFLIVCAGNDRLPHEWWRDKAASLLAVSEVAKILYFFAGGVFRQPKDYASE